MIAERLGLGPESQVVELASNDGYLLQWFVERGVPVLGVEPAANVAADGRRARHPDARRLLRQRDGAGAPAAKGSPRTSSLGNNVLAHVPDLNDFVAGVEILLKPDGTATFEFPHLLQLIEHNEFDTIYHEHFSYFSLLAVSAGVRARTASASSTSRSCAPTAARCGSTSSTHDASGRASGSRRCWHANARRGSTGSRRTRRSSSRCARRSATSSSS